MDALVIFESMYGNTANVAEAIGRGMREHGIATRVAPVTRLEPGETQMGLLVVGGPTHMHGLSREMTRSAAIRDEKNTYEEPTEGRGLREWLDDLPSGNGRPAAVFDTRLDASIHVTGSAAKGIAHRLARRGFRLAVPRESFLVTKDNRLVDGELGRAEAWGAAIALELGVSSSA